MSETNWNDLARRCEEATGPDRDIDWAIGFATGWRRDIIDGRDMVLDWECNAFLEHPGAIWPSVTESLDVITALIERELPGHAWSIVHRLTTSSIRPNGQIWTREERSTKHGNAATPALALCAAFARAMAHRSTPHE